MRNFSLLATALLFSLASYGQINVKDSLQTLLQNDTVDVQTRFDNAAVLITCHASPQEAEELCMNVGNNVFCAHTLYFLGATEIPQGNWAQAVEHLYEAIGYYDKAEMYVMTTELLHIIATGFFDLNDLAGMEIGLAADGSVFR